VLDMDDAVSSSAVADLLTDADQGVVSAHS
jgi:hypothetical protein